MIEQLCDSPEIYRIQVPLPKNPLRFLNSYVLRDCGQTLVIDTGFNMPECLDVLTDGLNQLNVDMARTKLFLTHLHSDHIGLAEYFAASNVPIYMSEIDYNCLEPYFLSDGWGKIEKSFLLEGFPPEELAKQKDGNQARLYAPRELFPVIRVGDGDILKIGSVELRCVLASGHTPGHICLYLPSRQFLFSGDHILFDITPNISSWKMENVALAEYLKSLDKVAKLPVARTFPGHRAEAGSPAERIKALKEHHRIRLNEILDALAENSGMTAYETAFHVSWSARGISFERFRPNQKWFAMGEVLAHIEYLRAQDRITSEQIGEVRRNFVKK